MIDDPRQASDYKPRQVLAAHTVLVDLGQVLAAFRDEIVVASVDHFGPRSLAEFSGYANTEERDLQARRAYELVLEFLRLVG